MVAQAVVPMAVPAVALVAALVVAVQINRVILVVLAALAVAQVAPMAVQEVVQAVVQAVAAPVVAVQINRVHRDLRLQKLHSQRMRTIAEHYRLKKIKPTAIQVAQRQELRFLMTLNRAIR